MKRPAGKITAGLLALVMLLCCGIPVYADDPTLRVELRASEVVNDEVVVELQVQVNPGIAGYTIALQYDPAALSIADHDTWFNGLQGSNYFQANDGIAGRIYATAVATENDNRNDILLFSVRFRLDPSFAGASTTVSILEGEPSETVFTSTAPDGEGGYIYPDQPMTNDSVKSVTINFPEPVTTLMGDFEHSELTFTDSGISGTALATINLNRGASYQAMAILACYDAGHRFIGCKTANVTVAPGDNPIAFENLNFAAEGAYLKLMVVRTEGFTPVGLPVFYNNPN